MITRCSKVDESFVDYLTKAKGSKGPQQTNNKYSRLLSNLIESMTNKNDQENGSNNFVVYFDQALYEAPPSTIELEEELSKSENEGAYKK